MHEFFHPWRFIIAVDNICQIIEYRPQPIPTEQQMREQSLVSHLHELINCGDMNACRILIMQNPGIINLIKPVVGSALHCAVAAGDAEVIRNLIDMGAHPDLAYLSYTPLNQAVCLGNIEAVKVLLEKGADPEGFRDGGFCPGPLHDACRKGDIEIAEVLIEAGASVARQDYEGKQALHYAAAHDDPVLTSMILDAGADPGMMTHDNYGTPMHRAAMNGNLQTLRVLLATDADPDGCRVTQTCCTYLTITNHFPPIAYAIINDHCDVVAELVHSGADLKSPVKIRKAFEDVVTELEKNSRHTSYEDPPGLDPVTPHGSMSPVSGVDVTTTEASGNATPAPDDPQIRRINHSPLPPCINREKEQRLFGKFGRDHPVFDGTMEVLKYSVYTEKADIIGLLLSSGKFSSSEVDSMKELAETCQLTRSLAALNKHDGAIKPETATTE